MQYELNVAKGEELKTKKQINKKMINNKILQKAFFFFAGGILLGRVSLLLNQADIRGIAPFGIAYLIAIVIKETKVNTLISAVGIIIGYLSIGNSITDSKKYLITIALITLYYMIISLKNKRKKELIGFGLVFASFIIYSAIINNYEIGVAFTLSLIETLVIVPIYYVIKYAMDSLESYKINKVFLSEELVSISIVLCLLVAGIGDVYVLDYSIKTICALAVVLAVAYIGGAANGAMIGVTMGIILGVSTNDMVATIGYFSVGGLVVGIFKDTGKIFSILAGLIIYFTMGIYSNELTLKFGIEVLASSCLFLCIPKTVYKSIGVDINLKPKKESISDEEIKSIKDEFTLKLKQLTTALFTISKCLGSNEENENLMIKSNGSELVESIADRCCSKCENRERCWERNFNQTFNSFQLMIQKCESGKFMVPEELQKKCVKDFTLLKSVESVINNYKTNEIIKDRISDGRRILAEHVNNMSNTLNELLANFKKEVYIDPDLQKRIKRQFSRNSIEFKDVFCYTNSFGRTKVKILLSKMDNLDYQEELILKILNKVMKKNLCISKDECGVNSEDEIYTVVLEEATIYKMVSYSQSIPKTGEKENGDSYSFGSSINGNYNIILSDGMGFGPQAQQESKSTVDLVENFMQAGFDESSTVNTINSIMGLRFSQDEKYATLDLSKIDLYTGDSTFVKIGAAPTFVKRGNVVKSINSKNLPFGLVDEVDVEFIQGELKPGDVLVNVTDGVIDSDKDNKFNWLEEYLKEANEDPKTLSEKIIERAKKLSGDEIKDDMTVVVSKIYVNS